MAPPSLSRSFPVLFLFISYVSVAAGGYAGVNYGRVANNLMSPERVVRLLRDNGIGAAAIYDADPDAINAFRNSGIKLAVSLRNELLENAARSKDYAGDWVWHNVGKYYPAVQIDSIAVGNEVLHQRPELTPFLVAAMQNVYDAIANLGYADRIKISTPVAFSAVDRSFPPSQGSFRGELQPVIRQILEFLTRTNSYFMADIYPYFAYRDNYPDIPLDYTLGRLPNPGVRDPNTGLMYYSLLDAQLDAVYSAMAALGYGNAVTPNATGSGRSLQQPPFPRRAVLKETGYPSSGGRPRAHLAWSSGASPDDAGEVLLEETGAARGLRGERAVVQQQPGAEDPGGKDGDAAAPRRRHGRLHLRPVQRGPEGGAGVGAELRAVLPGREEGVRREFPAGRGVLVRGERGGGMGDDSGGAGLGVRKGRGGLRADTARGALLRAQHSGGARLLRHEQLLPEARPRRRRLRLQRRRPNRLPAPKVWELRVAIFETRRVGGDQ